jgi:hypothetical protein
MRKVTPILFLIWLTILLAAFFIVQKPAWVSISLGLRHLFTTILFWILFVNTSLTLGYFVLSNLSNSNQKLIFSMGIGMGLLGLMGFLLSALGLINRWVYLFVLIVISIFTRKYFSLFLQDIYRIYLIIIRSIKYAPRWIPVFTILLFSLSFLLALAPPIESFDGLLYHLTVPNWWLRDAGLQLINMPHYWFPSLMEGMFVWSIAFGLDSTPQLIHFTFGVLTLSLIFNWTFRLFGSRAAWWSVAMGLSMPSLFWLSAWAYTDLGLAFYSIAALLSLSNWKKEANHIWLILSGTFCGFAMGIKYTAFILPVVCCFTLIWWQRPRLQQISKSLFIFIAFSLLSGGVWYLRNLIWMGNPFYPFVFGGQFWDSFRADWYTNAGSGIGLDVPELILLPFVTTLGYRDENFFDGRIGPFYLILFPLVIFSIWKIYKSKAKQFYNIFLITSFGFLSIAFWVLGVIQTHHLMQARLLFPALLALIPLFAKSILFVEKLELPKIKFQFIFSTIFSLVIFVFTLDFALLVFVRNPIMANMGLETRQSYTQRLNGSYAELLGLTEQTPQDAYIYLINEPRSYGITRLVQPDPINDNLPHDFYLYSTNVELVLEWKKIGYSHVVVRSFIFEETNENQHSLTRLIELREMLIELDKTEEYILFQIP